MPGDLGTYAGFKNWLIGVLFAALLTLGGMIVSDNRSRIDRLEARVSERGPILEDHAARLVRLESTASAQALTLDRRLDRIEAKLDKLTP